MTWNNVTEPHISTSFLGAIVSEVGCGTASMLRACLETDHLCIFLDVDERLLVELDQPLLLQRGHCVERRAVPVRWAWMTSMLPLIATPLTNEHFWTL